jgi:hypothetical protein
VALSCKAHFSTCFAIGSSVLLSLVALALGKLF